MRDALEPSVDGVIATLGLLVFLGLALFAVIFVYDVVLLFLWWLSSRRRRPDPAPKEPLEYINVSNEPRMIMHNVDGYTLKDKDAS